jgi:hypothetical protein
VNVACSLGPSCFRITNELGLLSFSCVRFAVDKWDPRAGLEIAQRQHKGGKKPRVHGRHKRLEEPFLPERQRHPWSVELLVHMKDGMHGSKSFWHTAIRTRSQYQLNLNACSLHALLAEIARKLPTVWWDVLESENGLQKHSVAELNLRDPPSTVNVRPFSIVSLANEGQQQQNQADRFKSTSLKRAQLALD